MFSNKRASLVPSTVLNQSRTILILFLLTFYLSSSVKNHLLMNFIFALKDQHPFSVSGPKAGLDQSGAAPQLSSISSTSLVLLCSQLTHY